jgi:hypothetical protein
VAVVVEVLVAVHLVVEEAVVQEVIALPNRDKVAVEVLVLNPH